MRTIILIIIVLCLFGIINPTHAQWQYSHYDIYPDQMFDCACVDSSTFWAVGSFGYVIKSTDSGRTWSPFSYANLTDNLYELDFSDPKHGFAASQYGVTIIATVDSGNTWNIACQNVPLGYISGLAFADSLHGFLSGNLLIYKTADGGYTWTIPNSFPENLGITDIKLINKDTVWACGATNTDPYHPMVIKTTDGGRVWDIITTLGDTLDAWIRAIDFSDQRHGWITLQFRHRYGCFLYSTTNGGTNWAVIDSFFEPSTINDYNNIVAFDSLHVRLAATVDFALGKIRKSTDGGYTWIDEFNGDVGDIKGFSMFDSTHGLVVGGPIWDNTPLILYYDNSTAIPENDNPTKPEEFDLSAYPNPFNSSVSISYSNMHGGEIGIYNLIGQKIRTFKIDGTRGKVIWDGTDENDNPVSSGVYFARMKTSLHDITVKLVLLK